MPESQIRSKGIVRIRGAELTGDTLRVRFEGGAGYQRLSVSLRW